MAMPKPKHCGQKWLEMTPAEGGRICGGCNKLITDFTKMRWAEIEKLQSANNNALCGMYTDKQLQHWGRQVPKNGCGKMAATAALFLSLAATLHTTAQTADSSKTILYGRVTDATGEPLISANVLVQGTHYGTATDMDGNYRLDITGYVNSGTKPVIEYTYIGYEKLEYKPAGNLKGEVEHHAQFTEELTNVIAFGVSEPTLVDEIRYSLQKRRERREQRKKERN